MSSKLKYYIIIVIKCFYWLVFQSTGLIRTTNQGHSWTSGWRWGRWMCLYGTVVMGRGLYYRLHVVLASLGPWTILNLAKSITTHFSCPTKPPLGIEYGFPTPPIISKCLSCHFNISFSLVQLVLTEEKVTHFSFVQEDGGGRCVIDVIYGYHGYENAL